MGVNIDEKGIMTFSTLAMKRSILEQVEVKEVKDVVDKGGKLLGYTSESWFLYSTPDGNKIFRMRANDVQTLMWQQLCAGLDGAQYKAKYEELNAELKTKWAELRNITPQIFIA